MRGLQNQILDLNSTLEEVQEKNSQLEWEKTAFVERIQELEEQGNNIVLFAHELEQKNRDIDELQIKIKELEEGKLFLLNALKEREKASAEDLTTREKLVDENEELYEKCVDADKRLRMIMVCAVPFPYKSAN